MITNNLLSKTLRVEKQRGNEPETEVTSFLTKTDSGLSSSILIIYMIHNLTN